MPILLHRCVRLALAALLLAGACACTPNLAEPAPSATAPAATRPGWAGHLAQFQEAYFVYNPSFAVIQGRHEFDGKLSDWSAAGIGREVDWLKAQRKATEAYDEAGLTPAQRFERQYLLSVIDTDLFWLAEAEQPFRNPTYYLNAGLDPSVYITRPYATPEARLKAFVTYAKSIVTAAAQMRANLRTPMPATFVDLATKGFAGYADFYRDDVPKAFASVTDPALQAELKAAIGPAAAAMKGLADWLKTEAPRATQDFALGPQKFADMLRMTERVTTPLPELQAIGKADLERNLAALKQACAQYLPRGTIEACIDKAGKDKPAGGPVEGARVQLAELRAFVAGHKLVTIPGEELALVAEAPPYQRSNFAYIDVPGPFDKGMPSVYYIAPPDPTWSKADQDAYLPSKADLLFTSVHEVWPGHFLQFLHANRSPFPFGQIFVGYAFAEGWAHYGEEMMWEAGLGDGAPGVHIGQLSNALLRNVRFLCAIGLHTQGMTVEACERMFREQAYQDPGNARQQAARGTYDPAYLNYTMGKLMIRKLRTDWTATHGGREGWLAFHDKLLSYGGPPLPLVREQMMGKVDGELF
ncbi:MAG TPA: DUF885 domain-containing protein [Solimonas sp.]|nr:DUF885 domain-containing protein [Solimonas sp.]